MLAERKTFLGWIIDSRRMRVYLPGLKTLRWITDIDSVLSKDRVGSKQLESLLGKLNHAAFIIPLSRYFLNRIRHSEKMAAKFGPQKLSLGTKGDLELFKDFLSIMSDRGTSIQNITHSAPDIICWSDACEYGLGGFDSSGNAWQWLIPSYLRGRISINLLEFLSYIITIQLSLENTNKNKKILAFTDNSSALGWLHKSSFHPAEKNKHDQAARSFARFMIKNEHSLYAEHIKGSSNNVADSLSREFNFTNQQLTNLLHIAFPEQMPHNFNIKKVPDRIISWTISLLESSTSKKGPKPNPSKKQIQIGENGKTFADKLGSGTSFSKILKNSEELKLSVLSQQRSEETILEKVTKQFCMEKQSKAPSDMYARSSGLTDTMIQELTSVEPHI